jgi:hypothetical protein
VLKARRTRDDGATRIIACAVIVASMVVAGPGVAQAAWIGSSPTVTGFAMADSIPQGNTPSGVVNGRDVAVSWAVTRFPSNNAPVAGYTVQRFDTSNVSQTVLASCTGTIGVLTCTEFGVPPGTWKYAVTPQQALWTGPQSVKSTNITVGSPSLTLTTTSFSSLPLLSGGSVANFLDGEAVSYHLDSAGGAVLAGSIASVPVGGSAAVSVTIPLGTTLGAHSVFAVGSLGSTASAGITVVDTTLPVVGAAVINKTLGDKPGFVKPTGTYFIYANANDAAGSTGTHVVSTVIANVTNVTIGSIAVPLTTAGGPFTIGGVSYAYRSASLITSAVAAGPKSFTVTATDLSANTSVAFNGTVTVDSTVPTASNIQTTNAGTIGKAETGDTITYTFSELMDPNSILALWTGASTPVTLHLNQAAGSDTVTIFNAGNTVQLPIGSVALGGTNFVTGNRTFTGSAMVMSGSTITITLGTLAGGAVATQAANSTMIWSPAIAATDLAGNACTLATATESGAADIDF